MNFKTYGSDIRTFSRKETGEFFISLLHVAGDPEKVYRLYIESPCGLKLEVTPSKGLSLRDCSYRDRQMFWEPPMENLPDPEAVDLQSAVICGGVPVPGRGWIRYFASHVEMLGLYNWGMERQLSDGRLFGLHGNVSNIPVEGVKIDVLEDRLRLTGSYEVFSADSIFPQPGEEPDFLVKKQIDIFAGEPRIFQKDTIVNLTGRNLAPDWGYHVQLRPQPGCRYMIPSREVKERSGGEVPKDYDLWKPAIKPSAREERGYIHRNLLAEEAFCDKSKGVRTLLKYKDSHGIEVIIPHSPYTMGWYSCGGGGGDDFLVPSPVKGESPSRLLEKNWDGVGPEIGASDLDHGDNTDPDVKPGRIKPMQKMSLRLEMGFLEPDEVSAVEGKIREYQQKK